MRTCGEFAAIRFNLKSSENLEIFVHRTIFCYNFHS
jgi:hypothetical protein